MDILEKIENILDRGVDELQTGLRRLLISPINSTDYQSFNVLSAESYNSVLEQLRLLNEAINKHNLLVQQKIDNPFDIIPYDETIKLATICDAANNALAALESERVIYNNIIKERKSTETELLSLNQEIAHFEIESAYISLANQREKKQQADDLLESTKDQISEKEKEKLQLDSQRKNFQIAVDEINRSLEYIFFCTGRLSLELGTDQMYHLKTNGKSVRPSNISCGERNALALCYYFTEISKDMDARTPYAGEAFLVIDDPISSFDLENRIGILSFLRWKLGLVLEGCANTKVLIMSHDVSVMFDLQKALQEISKRCEQIGKNAEHRLFQLNNKILSNFSYKYHNEYTQLLLRIYEYATSTAIDADSDLIIGNVIRRVMEAFSTFLFKKGIDEICTDEIIMGLLPDNNIRAYYRYLMYQIVLNNESHFFENIRGTPEINFFCHISSAEKQRTAKDILCFMYQLNKTHLLSHLPEAKQNLDVWCANINTIAER